MDNKKYGDVRSIGMVTQENIVDDSSFDLDLAKMKLTGDVINVIEGLDQLVLTAKTMEEFNEGKDFVKKKILELLEGF